MKILVVDDDEDVRVAMKAFLEVLGHTVIMARDGKEAVEILQARQGEFDLVLTDFNMPGMRGDEVVSYVQQRWPTTRAVLMSAASVVGDLARAVGADAFLQKPFGPREFNKLVQDFFPSSPRSPSAAA